MEEADALDADWGLDGADADWGFDGPDADELELERAMLDQLDEHDPPPQPQLQPCARTAEPREEAQLQPPEVEEVADMAVGAQTMRAFVVPGGVRPLTLRQQPTAQHRRRAVPSGSLLGRPFSQLLDAVDRERMEQQALASDPSKAKVTKTHNGSWGSQLWVDKYAPKTFMELLSDERVNRNVLRWVKQWDGHVFQSAHGKSSSQKKSWGLNPSANGTGMPERLLMLISGPPGLGKTTLAHVIAKHCGYRPVEINASDDRSAKVLKQRVKEATETQSAFGDGRPPLIILDEIDGAMGGSDGQGAINELVKLASSRASRDGNSLGLQRPIICICNNLYATALRPLRAVAEAVEFREASTMQIASRLRYICEREKMIASTSVLATLIQRAGHDVRTCLNTLQFIRAKSDTLTEELLSSVAVGKKDSGKSAFNLWKETFQSAAARNGPQYRTGELGVSTHRRLMSGLNFADVPRVIDGVAENYLRVGYGDPMLTRTVEAAEWLSFNDLITEEQFSKGHFALMPYMDFAVLAVHEQCAVSHMKESIEWPRSANNHRQMLQQHSQVLSSWHASMEAHIFNRYTSYNLVVDVLTPLLSVISPPISSTMVHVLNSEEKRLLGLLIDHMISFGLSFQQASTDSGTYTHKLDPPIQSLVPIGHEKASNSGGAVNELPAPIKQYVATELQREILRRHHNIMPMPTGGTLASASSPLHMNQSSRSNDLRGPCENTAAAANSRQGATSAAALAKLTKSTAPCAPRTDLFGRPIVDKLRKRAAPEGEHGPSFRFKYHEGVTDAVRRTVRVRDLL